MQININNTEFTKILNAYCEYLIKEDQNIRKKKFYNEENVININKNTLYLTISKEARNMFNIIFEYYLTELHNSIDELITDLKDDRIIKLDTYNDCINDIIIDNKYKYNNLISLSLLSAFYGSLKNKYYNNYTLIYNFMLTKIKQCITNNIIINDFNNNCIDYDILSNDITNKFTILIMVICINIVNFIKHNYKKQKTSIKAEKILEIIDNIRYNSQCKLMDINTIDHIYTKYTI